MLLYVKFPLTIKFLSDGAPLWFYSKSQLCTKARKHLEIKVVSFEGIAQCCLFGGTQFLVKIRAFNHYLPLHNISVYCGKCGWRKLLSVLCNSMFITVRAENKSHFITFLFVRKNPTSGATTYFNFIVINPPLGRVKWSALYINNKMINKLKKIKIKQCTIVKADKQDRLQSLWH